MKPNISITRHDRFLHQAYKCFVGLASLGFLCGCMGASSASTATTSTAAPAATTAVAPAVLTVSDAPLSNILSAVVTLSSVNLTASGSTTPVSLLSTPVTVELSGLGAVQEPIELTTLPLGNYNSATLAITSAVVTYLNSAGQATTATATLSQPTITVALAPALMITSQGEVQLQLAFNLAQSFSITGTSVTFTPAINTAAAAVSSENNGDRQVEVTGNVTSVSATSITVQSGDSGRQFTFTINSATQIANGATVATIQPGSIVQVQGQTQSDGSLLAVTVTQESNGNSSNGQEDGAKGIIVSVATGSNGVLTGFSMIPRESFGATASGGSSATGSAVTVTLSSTTTYALPEDAQQIGIASNSFSPKEIFTGQAVVVTGAAGTGSASGTIAAQQVMLAAESLSGTLTALPQAAGGGFSFTITLPANSYLGVYQNLPPLNVLASQMTEFGNGLSTSTFASTASGTNLELHGYLLEDSTGNATLYVTQVNQVQATETPEGGSDN